MQKLAQLLAATSLLVSAGAPALELAVEPTISKSRVETGSGSSEGSWPATSFEVRQEAVSGGVRRLVVEDWSLRATAGLTYWTFVFEPSPLPPGSQPDPAADLPSRDLTLWHDTGTGHVWSETVPIRAAHVRGLLGDVDEAAHYDFFLTTDETGTATGTPTLPTQCGVEDPNVFVISPDGKPFGEAGQLRGRVVGPDELVLVGAACPRPGETWPAASPTIEKTAVLFELAVRLDADACSDGLDNDGDGLRDFPADPGCRDGLGAREDPECQDGLDNDGDGGVDFDGGVSAGSGSGAPADARCTEAWRAKEKRRRCGLGIELALLAPLLTRLGRLRAAAGAPGR